MQTLLSQTMKVGIKDTRGTTGTVPGELDGMMSLKMGSLAMMERFSTLSLTFLQR